MSSLRRLPPLTSLRSFEAAGRHLSFTAAAEELGVTLSAVGHQVRQLEEHLGLALFHRTGRGLVLSAEGQLLLPGIQRGFEQFVQAVARLDAERDTGAITISMLSTFAMRWFIPRLTRFQALHPAIDVRISTTMRLVELEREGIDCAIRFGVGPWPGLVATRLFSERLTPVCQPSLAARLARPADLAGHRLLHSQNRLDHWERWLRSVGVTDIDAAAGPVFETRSFAIQAALQGLGVAVMDPSFVADEIAAGRLVRPFADEVIVDGAYWLVSPEHLADAPKLAALRAWLVEEVAHDPAAPEG